MFFYKVFQPSPALQPYVYNYSIVENNYAVMHNIMPRAAFILGILYKGSMELETSGGQSMAAGFTSGVMGIQDAYRTFYKAPGTGMLAVNFTPTGAAALLPLPLQELFNQACTLDNLFKRQLVAGLEERVAGAKDTAGRIRETESFLLQMIKGPQQDPLVYAGVKAIQRAKGIIKAEELAKALFISPGRLEKRFKKTVGATPKKFASLVRIAAVLKEVPSGKSLTALAYDAGYFDQPHFIHDFRHYTGYSPKQLLPHTCGQPPCGFVYGSATIPLPVNNPV
jgi:AraC-like DNA-binding protein